MAAAALSAWLVLQPGARTLRVFSTAVSPATHAVRPSSHATENTKTSKNARQMKRKVLPPRTEKMAVDQDWPSVYPVAAPFKPSAVPLPVRMGYPVKRGVPMAKEGNLELLKIPNFLHLTPVAIKKHCEALKDFCTEWPAALDSDEKCEKHFPIEIDTADYVSTGPSVRNPKARIVTLRVKLSSLNLDDHAKKKLIKLVGERYCKTTDVLTIKTDRCPLKRQNYDYAMYLLTVLYHESWHQSGKTMEGVVLLKQEFRFDVDNKQLFWILEPNDDAVKVKLLTSLCLQTTPLPVSSVFTDKRYLCQCFYQHSSLKIYTVMTRKDFPQMKTEEWEKNKTEADMEEYIWENSSSEKNILETLLQIKAAEKNMDVNKEELLSTKEVENYKNSVVSLKNEGENENTISQYKESVKKLLNLA